MQTTDQEVELYEYAESRGISPETLGIANACYDTVKFEGEDDPQGCIKFSYKVNDKEVNYKLRTLSGKKFKQKYGGQQVWFNLDTVLNGIRSGRFDEVYCVEGEWDACAFIECGIDNVLSLPSGAIATTDSSLQCSFIKHGNDLGLSKLKKWIFVTDNDDPGRESRNALANHIGFAISACVDFPHLIKDANDYLIQYGKEALLKYIKDNTEPWPIEGAYLWKQLPKPPPLKLWTVDMSDANKKEIWNIAPKEDRSGGDMIYKMGRPSLSVFSGRSGHGKTLFSQWMWTKIAKKYDIKVMLLSLETDFKPDVEQTILSAFYDRKFIDLSDHEIDEGINWIQDHFFPYVSDQPSPNQLLDAIEAYKIRYGISAVLVDPWNRFKRDKEENQLREDQWIRASLCDLHSLSKALKIHIQVICHPSKPQSAAGQSDATPLHISELAGSSAWGDVPDFISTIHRVAFTDEETGKQLTNAQIRILKSRNNLFGRMYKTFSIRMNRDTDNYISAEFDQMDDFIKSSYSTAIRS